MCITPVFPNVIFGTSSLGNLYKSLTEIDKKSIVEACLSYDSQPVVFDSAGKYGAGLALESLGCSLKKLGAKRDDVLISNKLGWYRITLKTPEPTFEPGVWKNIKYDAEQRISYTGILDCYRQGNELLNGYSAQLVSVHDPDDYLAAADSRLDLEKRKHDIRGAYQALFELKQEGKVMSVGVGAKDWRVIKEITNDVMLDWVMIANSMTIHSHPASLIGYLEELESRNIPVINAAIFNGGFLSGSNYYNYRELIFGTTVHAELHRWRERFYEICSVCEVNPVHACIQFGKSVAGVSAVALSASSAKRIKENIDMAAIALPDNFWERLRAEGLISENYQEWLLSR